MRRITLWILSTITALVLLFSYRTSTSGPGGTGGTADTPVQPGVVGAGADISGVPAPGSTDPTRSTHKPSSSGTPTSGASPNVVVNGTVAHTQWGPVQVRVRLTGQKITDVTAVVYPSGNGHDQAINSYALPKLRQQVLATQSAHINGVSGATVTSDGYRKSLQAALDAAHVGN